MPGVSTTPRTIVWLDPTQAEMVRRVAESAGLDLVAAGGPGPGGAGAQALGVEPVDDLRVVLASGQADLVWIAASADLDQAGADAASLLQAAARGVTVATLEPIPASALQLASGRWQRAELGRTALDTVRFLPLMRLAPAMREAAPVIEQFARPRVCLIRALARPEHGSLGARLFDAVDMLLTLMGEPALIDSSYAWPSETQSLHALPGETLADLQGDLTCNLRFADGRAACLAASNHAARWSRQVSLIAQPGRLELGDTSFVWHAPDGSESDASAGPERTGSLGEAVIADALGRLVDEQVPRPAPSDPATILAICQAALLSARTSQAESPATIRRIASMS